MTEQQSTQPISENLWWVISSKLAGVRKPTSEELNELRKAGIGAIISVFHDPSDLSLYQQMGIPYLWLPIAVDSVPSQAQIQEFQNFIDSQNLLNHAVAIHCSTGIHRTGTMLATYLIRAGLSYESAMKAILNSNPSVELPEIQATFLQRMAHEQFGFSNSSSDPQAAPIETSISENLWWVIPSKLAGVRKPLLEEMHELQVSGIGALVSVLDDPSNLALYDEANIPHLWLPTQGGTAPSPEQVQKLQGFVDQQNQIGNAVAIHCTNGRRRTATMIAAYLISSGSSYAQAMQMIQRANSNIDLRDAQTIFLQALAEE